MLEGGEERRDGLADLEVDGAVLDLDDDVRFKFAVKAVEVVITGPGTVGLEVIPVQMVVVDEAAVQNDTAMRLEGTGNGVGSLGRSAAVFRGADAALGISLDDEAGEVGDGLVDLIDLRPPPVGDLGVKRIESGEVADYLGAREINREGHADTPGTEGVGDARELADHLRIERVQIGVDVVDGSAVEADGSKETSVFGDTGEVGADVAVVVENAAAGVTALDAAVEVVPLVDPAYGRGGRFRGRGEGFLLGDLFEDVEDAVKFAAAGAAGDDPVGVALRGELRDGKAFRSNRGWGFPGGKEMADLAGGADDEGVFARERCGELEVFAEHRVQAAG